MLVVPCPSHRRGGDGFFDSRDLRSRERDLQRAERLSELGPGACTNQRHDTRAFRQHPRNGELSGDDTFFVRQTLQCIDQPLVPLAILAAEARKIIPKVAGRGWLGAAQQAA